MMGCPWLFSVDAMVFVKCILTVKGISPVYKALRIHVLLF